MSFRSTERQTPISSNAVGVRGCFFQPNCDWVHLVFTLPDTLWPVFESNRWLLNDVCRLAVENLLYAARKRGLEPGIFCAIHTYDRRLNWHPHQA